MGGQDTWQIRKEEIGNGSESAIEEKSSMQELYQQ